MMVTDIGICDNNKTDAVNVTRYDILFTILSITSSHHPRVHVYYICYDSHAQIHFAFYAIFMPYIYPLIVGGIQFDQQNSMWRLSETTLNLHFNGQHSATPHSQQW